MRSAQRNGEHFTPLTTPAFRAADPRKPRLGWNWPARPVAMPSRPRPWMGGAGWLSKANGLQMEFNTGVCGEVIWESFPDVVKCLQLPAKLLGAFKTAYHWLENVYRGEQKPRTFIHV